jgi:voltage-gated potassium channel
MLKYYKKDKRIRIGVNILGGILVFLLLIEALIRVESISSQSALHDYPNAIWYAFVTLTTVGYGDLYPTTTYGRIIGLIFVLLSMFFYALLIGGFASFIGNIRENKRLGYNGINFKHHAVIIGWNEFGNMVADQLLGVGKQVVVITDNRQDVDFIHEKYKTKNVFVLFSELKNYEFFKKVNIEFSSNVFVNLEDDTEKLVYILNMKKYFPDLEFVVTLDNGDLRHTFLTAGVSNTISNHEISSKLLASYMFEPDVATYSESIMSFAKSDSDYDIKQLLVTSKNPLVNKNYQDAFFELKKKYNSVLIGITKRDKFGKRRLVKNPQGDFKIVPGDYLLIIMNGKAFKVIKKVFNVEEGYFREKKRPNA